MVPAGERRIPGAVPGALGLISWNVHPQTAGFVGHVRPDPPAAGSLAPHQKACLEEEANAATLQAVAEKATGVYSGASLRPPCRRAPPAVLPTSVGCPQFMVVPFSPELKAH